MAHNELNYLKEVRKIQQLTQERIDEHVYITYKMIWGILCSEDLFFKGYKTFLKYISEPRVATRIADIEKNK